MTTEEMTKVFYDLLIEQGATVSDAEDVVRAAKAAVSEGPGKTSRSEPLPDGLTGKTAEAWCESHGGHSISGFCESWSCNRCGLSGWD